MSITTPARPSQCPACKSPLRTAGLAAAITAGEPQAVAGRRESVSGADLRQLMISEYTHWLRSVTNKNGRPFQEGTVTDYAETARVLHRWMSG